MAKFVFTLEPVLDRRKRQEQERQRAVAELERERLALEDALRARRAAMDDCRADLRSALAPPQPGAPGIVDLRGARMQSAASFRLFADAQRLALRLAGTLKRLEASRADLLRAATDRKAVELLKERRRAAWLREQARRESALADEMTVMRAGRRDQLETGV